MSESTFPPADMANVQVHLDAFAGRLVDANRAFVRITVDLAVSPSEPSHGLLIGLVEHEHHVVV
ncbi:hypothetical protein [uncultured Methylobacterium sp.]|uniref:hypothetical protein n=1 Tax=uncultured Methylobacterium sp. TaxID=157278 RepID=UPI002624CDD2|nr:hypothetical protein [uncultured Methylobacterium sp.]